jgi:hypothetical protein
MKLAQLQEAQYHGEPGELTFEIPVTVSLNDIIQYIEHVVRDRIEDLDEFWELPMESVDNLVVKVAREIVKDANVRQTLANEIKQFYTKELKDYKNLFSYYDASRKFGEQLDDLAEKIAKEKFG